MRDEFNFSLLRALDLEFLFQTAVPLQRHHDENGSRHTSRQRDRYAAKQLNAGHQAFFQSGCGPGRGVFRANRSRRLGQAIADPGHGCDQRLVAQPTPQMC